MPLLIAAFLIGGCSSDAGLFGAEGFSRPRLLGPNGAAPGQGEKVVLARDPAVLANGSEVEVAIHNAVELSRQKRFAEARRLLDRVRANQPSGSDGFQAIGCAMALLALSEGDIGTFRRIAGQLDDSLGSPVRVPPAYVEVITLYRAIVRKALPVNAPESMKSLEHMLPDVQRARS